MSVSWSRHLRWVLPPILVVAWYVGIAPRAAADPATAEVRVAHFSPETGGADVWVSPIGGTKSEFAHDVTYGGITKYTAVPAGTYVVSMYPTGVTTGKPLLAGDLTLAPGGDYTVIVTGPTNHLVDKVIDDNLAPPPSGRSKVRIIQASTTAGSPTIKVVPQPTLATDLSYASVTGYGVVPEGTWKLRISTEPKLTVSVKLASNTIYTLTVLNGPNHTVIVHTTADTVAPPATPTAVTPTAVTPPATAPTSSALPNTSTSYSVRSGDNLWDIAEGVLASSLGHTPTNQQVATYTTALIAANASRVANPNLIYPGQSLVLPPT